jgi:glucose-1-phosphate thymidylyltransferase
VRGIILAGGYGTRLYPITLSLSKQLLPIYDKPMIYYPLSTLMGAGIREILIISTARDLPRFKDLLSDGSQLGCEFEYKVQEKPIGLADAFIVGADFIGKERVAMILGDNIFCGSDFDEKLRRLKDFKGAISFAAQVTDPQRYGVYEFDNKMNVISIVEKPKRPKSAYANAGLYFFDNEVIGIAKSLKPSQRGELEITDVLTQYVKRGKLNVFFLERGMAWFDTGTFESMGDASEYVRVVEKRTGVKLGCIEEVAYRQNLLDIVT